MSTNISTITTDESTIMSDLQDDLMLGDAFLDYITKIRFENMNDLMNFNDVIMLSDQQKTAYAEHICKVSTSWLVDRDFQMKIYDYMVKSKLFDFLSDRSKGYFIGVTARAIIHDGNNLDEAFPILESISYLLTNINTDLNIPSYYYNYGYLYNAKGDFDNAKKCFLEAAEIHKRENKMEAYFSRMYEYYSACDMRNVEEYKKSMLQFLSIVPKDLATYEMAINNLKKMIILKEIEIEIENLIKKDASITNDLEKLEKEIKEIENEKQKNEYYEKEVEKLINQKI